MVASSTKNDTSFSPFFMVILFVIWYSFNAGYNVYNATLKVFPLPITIALVQLLVGLFYVLPLWILGVRKVSFQCQLPMRTSYIILFFSMLGAEPFHQRYHFPIANRDIECCWSCRGCNRNVSSGRWILHTCY